MDLEDISRLCAKMKLDDSDGLIIHMKKEMYAHGAKKMALYLIGRVLTNKVVNCEVLEDVLNQV